MFLILAQIKIRFIQTVVSLSSTLLWSHQSVWSGLSLIQIVQFRQDILKFLLTSEALVAGSIPQNTQTIDVRKFSSSTSLCKTQATAVNCFRKVNYEPTMQLKAADPTLTNKYSNNEEEYVFCVKGRPFACLVSPHLPTPTASLVDFSLVRDTGLKMSDLQCSKFSFGGQKMRILGKVSITVQCIHDGVSSGTFHIKGNVVLDLSKHFDTDVIAGTKMRSLLIRDRRSPSPTSPSSRRSPSPSTPSQTSPTASQARPSAPSSSKARPSAPPTPARTPAQTPPRSRPPGTPLFKDADVQPDLCKERLALFECDVDGDIEVDTNGKNTFYLTGGFVYRSGHGREKCSMAKCLNTKEDVPNNCGFHGQFILPNWFKPCGPSCRGGYCLCLRFYDSYLCKYLWRKKKRKNGHGNIQPCLASCTLARLTCFH